MTIVAAGTNDAAPDANGSVARDRVPSRDGAVTVVVNTYNDARFLATALESVRAQTVRTREVIVVDDGSAEDVGPFVAAHCGVRLIRQANAGLAAARNTGLAEVTTPFVLFLDADDRLLPEALERSLACFHASPGAGLVYGAHRRVDGDWNPLGPDRYSAVGPSPYRDLLSGNRIGMHATVVYRTDALRTIGGFDASLRLCEDYDVYLRLAREFAIACHPAVVAEYRWHGKNVSADRTAMLAAVLDVHGRHADTADPRVRAAWEAGRSIWTRYYSSDAEVQGHVPAGFSTTPSRRSRPMAPMVASLIRRIAPALRRHGTALRGRLDRWPPAVGRVRFGDFCSTRPVSLDFGFDRGLPIDRHYIEHFLARQRADVHGVVLEIGDDSYCRRFGDGRVTTQDVLHVDGTNPLATIVGELTQPALLTDDRYDCIVLTQTLHLIYDFTAAARNLHAALKPGGTLLLTVPGISQIDRGRWGDTWYWSFTRASMRRLFSDVFGDGVVVVEAYGNVFAATTYLQGLAVAEVDPRKLEPRDDAYPVVVTVRARKR